MILLLIILMVLTTWLWYEYGSRYVGYLYDLNTQSRELIDAEIPSLKIIAESVETDPPKALARFARKGVKVIVGPPTSGKASLFLPYLKKFNMVAISGTISSSRVLQSGYVFSMTPSNDYMISMIERFLEQLGVKNLLIVLDPLNAEYSEEYLALGKKFAVKSVRYYNEKSLAKVDLEGVDMAILTLNSRDAAQVSKLLRLKKPDIKLLGTDSTVNNDLINFGGSSVEGMLVIYPHKIEQEPEQELIEDCFRILENHRFLVPEQFRRFIQSHVISSRGYNVYFSGNSVVRPIYLYVVRNGRFEVVGTWRE
ncbi:amino acid ABC transporter substrate-binding protein [Fervidobacterium thailandense]|uniref:amino acid ABC transporter substrate-binding protein n=1 Tax=Fervidobacterium thailandense TaxID=1008305 RepID=UPI001112F0BF|nr:amino acid ABC transporter substrate-binding protein [Fervidobacterium thailandense]